MASGCRDCSTCTKSGLGTLAQAIVVGVLYLCTLGIAYLAKRAVRRHCPQCGHVLSRHARRADGSFRD
ncbi:hypothetical protein [Streptomyces iconiensis]|uniref:FeoB-associated Cys-rich membrane protein n=1 Tax=Streptomyces iconiensis TaxID=1384038 RepID=A0ABT6ZQI3_9ACTN|nr:hypothetical protein [Streptomyces iconiensis]MDJ1131317.1 hypothetical protein [Streptomyces iconiensis]